MAFRTINRYTRPNKEIPWHTNITLSEENNQEMMTMMFTEFHGKKTRTVTEIDDYNLEVEYLWESEDLYNDYASRPVTIEARRLVQEYCNKHGITSSPRLTMEV